MLICSMLGGELASMKYERTDIGACFELPNLDEYISDLNMYIVSRVFDVLIRMKGNILVFDGLVSIGAVQILLNARVIMKICTLDAPYEVRIERLMERLKCERPRAINEEKLKAHRKEILGMSKVNELSDYVLDGTKSINELLECYETRNANKQNS